MKIDELKEKYTYETSRFVTIDELDVHYCDEGDGEVILLVHGTFSSLHSFDDWNEILKKQYRVIRLDLPGFGLTGPHPEHLYSIDDYIDFLNSFLEKLQIKSCSIAGNSLGGWLSWELAVKYQNRIDKLILIDSAGYINDKKLPLPFIIAKTPVLRNVFNYVPRAFVRRFLRQVFRDQSKVTDKLVNRYYDLFHRKGNKEAFVKLANLNYVQNTNSLSQLKMPVLIMWGANDNWINVKQAALFEQELQNSEVIIYDNIGHVPMEEAPEITAKDLILFLKKNERNCP